MTSHDAARTISLCLAPSAPAAAADEQPLLEKSNVFMSGAGDIARDRIPDPVEEPDRFRSSFRRY